VRRLLLPDGPVLAAILATVGGLLLVVAALVIALGVLASRDAAMKPPITSCGIAPHVEMGW
jgi:hypothetical protein